MSYGWRNVLRLLGGDNFHISLITLITFVSTLISRELLIICNVWISTLYCVYGNYFLDSLIVWLGYHWDFEIQELVQSYWMWTAKCVYGRQYGSAIYGVSQCAILSSDIICLYIYIYVFYEGVIYFIFGKCTVVINLLPFLMFLYT